MARSGMEMMANMMGMGPVMDAAKGLLDAGAVQKILAFADAVEGMNERLDRIERALSSLAGGTYGQPRVSGATGGAVDSGYPRLVDDDREIAVGNE